MRKYNFLKLVYNLKIESFQSLHKNEKKIQNMNRNTQKLKLTLQKVGRLV